jgi:hypothetical protein
MDGMDPEGEALHRLREASPRFVSSSPPRLFSSLAPGAARSAWCGRLAGGPFARAAASSLLTPYSLLLTPFSVCSSPPLLFSSS